MMEEHSADGGIGGGSQCGALEQAAFNGADPHGIDGLKGNCKPLCNSNWPSPTIKSDIGQC